MSLPYSLLSGPSGIGDTKLHDERIGNRDDFTHDYAACQDELCILCSAYLDGHNQGEEKAYSRYGAGIPSNTRHPAGVIRVWQRGRC